jgi:hypothetical protein
MSSWLMLMGSVEHLRFAVAGGERVEQFDDLIAPG